jgi:hypothetical protein
MLAAPKRTLLKGKEQRTADVMIAVSESGDGLVPLLPFSGIVSFQTLVSMAEKP